MKSGRKDQKEELSGNLKKIEYFLQNNILKK